MFAGFVDFILGRWGIIKAIKDCIIKLASLKNEDPFFAYINNILNKHTKFNSYWRTYKVIITW